MVSGQVDSGDKLMMGIAENFRERAWLFEGLVLLLRMIIHIVWQGGTSHIYETLMNTKKNNSL